MLDGQSSFMRVPWWLVRHAACASPLEAQSRSDNARPSSVRHTGIGPL